MAVTGIWLTLDELTLFEPNESGLSPANYQRSTLAKTRERVTRIELAFSAWETDGSQDRHRVKFEVRGDLFKERYAQLAILTLQWHH